MTTKGQTTIGPRRAVPSGLDKNLIGGSGFSCRATRFPWSLARRASVVENFYGSFDRWLNFWLVQNSFKPWSCLAGLYLGGRFGQRAQSKRRVLHVTIETIEVATLQTVGYFGHRLGQILGWRENQWSDKRTNNWAYNGANRRRKQNKWKETKWRTNWCTNCLSVVCINWLLMRVIDAVKETIVDVSSASPSSERMKKEDELTESERRDKQRFPAYLKHSTLDLSVTFSRQSKNVSLLTGSTGLSSTLLTACREWHGLEDS